MIESVKGETGNASFTERSIDIWARWYSNNRFNPDFVNDKLDYFIWIEGFNVYMSQSSQLVTCTISMRSYLEWPI